MYSSNTVFKTQKLKYVYIADRVSCENEHLFVRRLVNSVLHHLRKPKVCVHDYGEFYDWLLFSGLWYEGLYMCCVQKKVDF